MLLVAMEIVCWFMGMFYAFLPIVQYVAETFALHSSIMVSSKDSDGSVYSGIQSLVRYLLARALPEQQKKTGPEKKSKKKKKKVAMREKKLFTDTGANEVSDLVFCYIVLDVYVYYYRYNQTYFPDRMAASKLF